MCDNPWAMRDTVDHKFAESPESIPQDARILRTRAALQQALIDLSEEDAFEAITVRAIAARAGVGYATFFRHYPDKEALLSDVAGAMTVDLLQVMKPLFMRGDSLAAARSLCDFVAEHRSIHQALLAGGSGEAIRSWLLPEIMDKINAVRGAAPRPPLAELLLRHSISATLNLLAAWLRQPDPMSPADAAALINDLVLVPTLTAQGR
jgi:AcrR family transcriptional regulator